MPVTVTTTIPGRDAAVLLHHTTRIFENISQINEYKTGKTWARNTQNHLERIYLASFPNDAYRVTVAINQASNTLEICAYDQTQPGRQAMVSRHHLKYYSRAKLEITDRFSLIQEGGGRLTVEDLIHITRSLSILVQM